MKRCREEEKDSSKKKSKLGSEDFNLDVLGEIKKRLFGGDYIRFGAVCKNWMAAQHEKRAADVLPWDTVGVVVKGNPIFRALSTDEIDEHLTAISLQLVKNSLDGKKFLLVLDDVAGAGQPQILGTVGVQS
ncbi:hypothetical protein POM88_049412 [Heracleum sosnowskyi]|uniref:Uncharacterized protein n=1 Tax=Heracleum sosnowskyi TaxID=360622 RepID=A0AAD8GY96_9APIA|nr:hypothetical protein POM88_049412 [Heracleum sosnowskyi]